MKNRITTTITTMMLMLFSYGINIFAQSENVVPSGYPELDEWVKQCKVERPNALGHPGNYDSKLDSFYDWYTQNKMENILINNAGDPFGNLIFGNKGRQCNETWCGGNNWEEEYSEMTCKAGQ